MPSDRFLGGLDPISPLPAVRRFQTLELVLNLLGIASVSVGTLPELPHVVRLLAAVVTGLVATFFLLAYAARLWWVPQWRRFQTLSPAKARWKWFASPVGLVDLLAVVPAFAALSGGAHLGAESAAVFVLLWVLKLASRSSGVLLIWRVVRNERSSLGAAAALFLVVLFASATVAHWLEADLQPERFGSIPSALWWAVVTLSTTGYGDVVPLTPLGRLLGGVLMLTGIVVMALLAGILATGFAEEMRRREFMRVWGLVSRVPFFATLNGVAIAQIVGHLRSGSYPAGATLFHRGEAGDAMYFLVTGSVEVRLEGRVRLLHAGDHFGEMALLDRQPRSAEVVTVTPCTVLILNVADFYQLAAQYPALMAVIEAEAQRRHQLDGETNPGG